MPTYNWPLIQQRGGESIESLIATLLRREYTDVRQVNPSQGDGGIDILRSTPGGLEVWQVKGFTSAMTESQYRQVKNSWSRFIQEHVTPGEFRIIRYHLVTPWTPTEERLSSFNELTESAQFPCQWDGDAFIAGLADRYPETMQRFTYGEGVLEHFISQKAMLASSPVERGESLTMLEAIETREDALDDIRDTVSDNYRIESGTHVVTSSQDVPLPPENDAAAYHRMTYLGDRRWRYDSIVPRSSEALEIEPINLNVEFLAARGTPEYDAVQAWSDWGFPLKNARVKTLLVGGPFSEEEPVESLLSSIERRQETGQSLYLRCITSEGSSRFRLPLAVTARTAGAHTGWLRVVAHTPEHALSIELRIKQHEAATMTAKIGDADGCNPEAVRDEIETLLRIGADDVLSVETANSQSLVRARRIILPTGLEALHLPISRYLAQLQSRTSSVLTMPSVEDTTDGQFRYLELLASIYNGKAHHWTWSEITLEMPDDAAEATHIRNVVSKVATGDGTIVNVEEPLFQLGDRTYSIDHPLANTAHSVKLEPGIEPAKLHHGQIFRLIPGDDVVVTTAMIVDWTPGSILFR